MTQEDKLIIEAKVIQIECHKTVEYLMREGNKNNIRVQDAVNVFFYRKLAELNLEIKNLKERISSYEDSNK